MGPCMYSYLMIVHMLTSWTPVSKILVRENMPDASCRMPIFAVETKSKTPQSSDQITSKQDSYKLSVLTIECCTLCNLPQLFSSDLQSVSSNLIMTMLFEKSACKKLYQILHQNFL